MTSVGKKTHNSKQKNDELLIYGYCRRIQTFLKRFNNSIPEEIIILCLQFFPKIQILTWNQLLKSDCIGLKNDNKCAHLVGNCGYVLVNCDAVKNGIRVWRWKVLCMKHVFMITDIENG